MIFAVSVLAAKVTQVPTARANICAAVFVVARCFYNYFYITGTNQTKAVLRSLTWFVGMGGEWPDALRARHAAVHWPMSSMNPRPTHRDMTIY